MNQIDEPENLNPLLGEALLRRDFPQNTISRQDGFELKNLRGMAERFVKRGSRSLNKERPLGWFITFSGNESDGTAWRAQYISQIRIEELYMTIVDKDENLLEFDENWLEKLSDSKGVLHLERLKKENPDEDSREDIDKYETPATVRLHHYQYASNYADAQYAANNPTKLGIVDVVTDLGYGYGVGVIKGYRRNLRAAYMDYNTILQIYHAYTINPESGMRFIFTGAEINYGEMASPAFQQERFKDWIETPEGLDPSVCSTLKIEAVFKTDNDNGLVRYASGVLYPGVGAEDEEGLLSLPGLFILPSCRRYWEVVAKIQAAIVPTGELFPETRGIADEEPLKKIRKKGKDATAKKIKKQVAVNDKRMSAFKKITKGVTGDRLRDLIEKGQSFRI